MQRSARTPFVVLTVASVLGSVPASVARWPNSFAWLQEISSIANKPRSG